MLGRAGLGCGLAALWLIVERSGAASRLNVWHATMFVILTGREPGARRQGLGMPTPAHI